MTSISDEKATSATSRDARNEPLRGVIASLLEELQRGSGDKDKRRQVEEWMRNLAEKYPGFSILPGLRDYYLAEADRLRSDFEEASDLTEKLNLGRMIESFLEKAADMDRRIQEQGVVERMKDEG